MIDSNRLGLMMALVMLSALGSGLRGRAAQNPDQASDLASLQRAFKQPPEDSKIMMRWWWFGPSVTKPELEREMRAMKEGGIGGFAGHREPGLLAVWMVAASVWSVQPSTTHAWSSSPSPSSSDACGDRPSPRRGLRVPLRFRLPQFVRNKAPRASMGTEAVGLFALALSGGVIAG